MPHIIAEYSANLEDTLDVQALADALHQVMIDSGLAEIAAIRTRGERRDIYRIADGNPQNGFVHIISRLRIGRSKEQLQKLADGLLAAADHQLESTYKKHPTMLAVEIHEIDQLTVRKNTLREKSSAV